MPGKIKNPYYKAFINGDLIYEIRREDFEIVLDELQHQYQDQAKSLLILLWATGARPNEVLRLTGKHFIKTDKYLDVKLPGSKGSMARMVRLPLKDSLIQLVWEYVKTIPGSMYCFYFFRSRAKRYGVTKTYTKKNKITGEKEIVTKRYDKIYDEVSSKLRYYLPKWFNVLFPEGIPPYYLRHNRMSIAAENLDSQALMLLKGSKTEGSIRPYIHQTRKTQRKISQELMK